jgi:hypothetical protein
MHFAAHRGFVSPKSREFMGTGTLNLTVPKLAPEDKIPSLIGQHPTLERIPTSNELRIRSVANLSG